MTDTVFVLNGPNLNLLGTREPRDLRHRDARRHRQAMLSSAPRRCKLKLDIRQSNHEGVLVDWLHEAHGQGRRR